MAMREVRDVDVSFNERQGLLIRIYDYEIKHGTCSMAMRGRNTLALRTFLSFEAFPVFRDLVVHGQWMAH